MKKFLVAAAILAGFLLTNGRKALADEVRAFALVIQNGGVFQGGAVILNADGTSATLTVSGGVATIAAIGAPPSGTAGGDLSGTYPNPSVIATNGKALPASAGVTATNSSKQIIAAVASGVVGLFTGCTGILYLGADGACHASSGGTTVTWAPPYLSNGTNSFVASTGYQATKPSTSPTFINSVSPTVTAGTNGDVVLNGTGTYWAELSGTTSVEAEFQGFTASTSPTAVGVFLFDTTNSIIYTLGIQQPGITSGEQTVPINSYTYNGSGNPAFSANLANFGVTTPGTLHYKIVKSGGTASFQVSLNGGANFITLTTHPIGTVADGGYFMVGGGGGGGVVLDVFSLVVN